MLSSSRVFIVITAALLVIRSSQQLACASDIVLNTTNNLTQLILSDSQPIVRWNLLNSAGAANTADWMTFEWLQINEVNKSAKPVTVTTHPLIGLTGTSESVSYLPAQWSVDYDTEEVDANTNLNYELSLVMDNQVEVRCKFKLVSNTSQPATAVNDKLLVLDKLGSIVMGLEIIGAWPGATSAAIELDVTLRTTFGGGGPYPKPQQLLDYPSRPQQELQIGYAQIDVPTVVRADETKYVAMPVAPQLTTVSDSSAQIDITLSCNATSFTTEADMSVMMTFKTSAANQPAPLALVVALLIATHAVRHCLVG